MSTSQTRDEFACHLASHGVSPDTVVGFLRQKQADDADMKTTIEAMQAHAESTRDELLVSEVIILETEYRHYCGAVMANLSETTRAMYGDAVWSAVFGGVHMPEAGWTLEELSDFTKRIEQRYLSAATREQYETAQKLGGPWAGCYLDGDAGHYTYDEIDAILGKMNADFLELLKSHRASGELFFNQTIDDAVIRAYESGRWDIRREGDKIIDIKIPFLMSRYLIEPDERLKRHYACHCPWARKSILAEQSVSSSFCHCSLSYTKRVFEDAFRRPLDGRVVGTVLDGRSLQCVFEIDIPADMLVE